ncbi:hypothetical protein Kisp02_35420 [Kineosporia sp. NBRC 101731]|nr:hypothetical protein Kisp02_35420 [Kineosporia sp. NBRC 101731]
MQVTRGIEGDKTLGITLLAATGPHLGQRGHRAPPGHPRTGPDVTRLGQPAPGHPGQTLLVISTVAGTPLTNAPVADTRSTETVTIKPVTTSPVTTDGPDPDLPVAFRPTDHDVPRLRCVL